MGEPGPVVVALRRHEHLRLVLEPPERLRVHDPIPVPLERRPHRTVRLRLAPPRRIRRGSHVPEVLRLAGADPLLERGGFGRHDPDVLTLDGAGPTYATPRIRLGSDPWQRRH